MKSETVPATWLYYKIFLGANLGKTDHVITGALREVARLEQVTRWFYLRYTDEGGPHIRLRLQSDGDVTALRGAVEPILARALIELPTVPPGPYRPTIMPPLSPEAARPANSDGSHSLRLELNEYERDIESFGEQGITIAEELFFNSSEVSLRVLTDERDQCYSRKTLAPLLMKAIGDHFLPGSGPSFWNSYTAYWLGSPVPGGDDWRLRFHTKAEELRAQGVSVLPPHDQLPGEAIPPLSEWRRATEAAASAFRTVGDQPARLPSDLAFHFLHSMNNRLGLMPIEEAYFAALIAESPVVACIS
jgi:thiopeptide-type bacteriocin biosynthesis protein